MALAYLRMALRLDPTRDEAWMMVGDVLSTTGDAPGAQAAWSEVHADSPQYLAARGKLAWGRQEAGDKAGAIKLARDTLTAAPDNKDAAITLADLLRSDDQFDASAKVLDGVILAQGAAPDWRLLYMRAVDLQESGRWPDAERDLRAAMTLHPDEPELLNFLGYSWIDRGEHLAEALGMVKKAVDLNPRSGAIVDSLGWAYFRLGDYTSAVRHLETAVGLEPADPDVNDHLGDAYWRVGRETEARFQWRRVLTLAPSAKLKAAVEAKLKIGLVVSAPPAVIAGG